MIILKLPPVRVQVWIKERESKLTFIVLVVTDVRSDPKPKETRLLTRADIMCVISIYSVCCDRFL